MEFAMLAPYGIPVAAGVVVYLIRHWIRHWWHGPPGPEGDTLVAL